MPRLKSAVAETYTEIQPEIKQSFDPNNLFNPGKIISDGRYQIDRHLRLGAGYSLKLPFEPRLAFAANCPDAELFRSLVGTLVLRPT